MRKISANSPAAAGLDPTCYTPDEVTIAQLCQPLQQYQDLGVASHSRNGAGWEAAHAVLTVAALCSRPLET